MREILYERAGLRDSTHTGGEMINSSRFAFLLLLGADVMLYVGLLGGYFVLRGGSLSWPPPGSPAVSPSLMIWTCPLVVLAAIGIGLSVRWHHTNTLNKMRLSLAGTLVMLALFLAVNATEWMHLLSAGLDIMTVYGGIYLIVMGVFILHIIGASMFVIRMIKRVSKWRTYTRSANSIPHLAMFLYLQTAIWLALYALIYIY
jgi:heme/copper-type cytochrome/quinol oxidase subunit 3